MLIAVLAFAVGTRIRSPWDEAIENARTPEVTAYVVEQSVSLPVPEIAGTVHLGGSSRFVVMGLGRVVET